MRLIARSFPVTAQIAALSVLSIAHAETMAQTVATVSSPDKQLVVELQVQLNPSFSLKLAPQGGALLISQ